MSQTKKGEIATLLTLGTLLVIGISTFVSSHFLKNKQTTKSLAAALSCTSCNTSGKCIYHPELDARSGQKPPETEQCTDTGCIYNSECSSTGKNMTCRTYNDFCSTNPDPNDPTSYCCGGLDCIGGKCQPKATIPIAVCPSGSDYKTNEDDAKKCPGGLYQAALNPGGGYIPSCWKCINPQTDASGAINRACCVTNKDCEANGSNQVCGVANGACRSGKSCAEVATGYTKPRYARMCSGASCAWTYCDGKNADITKCTEESDPNKVPANDPSIMCISISFCQTFTPTKSPGVNSCRDSLLKTQPCPATYTESCGGGFSQKVHRDCTQSNTSGCQYWCSDKGGKKVACGTAESCYVSCPSCKSTSIMKSKTKTPSVISPTVKTEQQNNCSKFNGSKNIKNCIKNDCDYFETYDDGITRCDKCVVKGTNIQEVCPSSKLAEEKQKQIVEKTIFIPYSDLGLLAQIPILGVVPSLILRGAIEGSRICNQDVSNKVGNEGDFTCEAPVKVEDVFDLSGGGLNVTYRYNKNLSQYLCFKQGFLNIGKTTCIPISK